ncbi:MAG: stage III sporulation protein AF [Anaerovoracaceae bacterium]
MIKQWVSNLFIIILALTFIEMLIPETSMGKYLKFIFSLVIMATIMYPIIYLIGEY